MNPEPEWAGSDDTEALFRRVMARATDRAWELRVDEEALAALYDVLREGQRRHEGRGCRPRCWRLRPLTPARKPR
jgi:hypothetical protein